LIIAFNSLRGLDASFWVQYGTLEDAKSNYDFSRWGGSTKTTYVHTVTNWLIDFNFPGVTNVVTYETTVSTNANEVSRYREYGFDYSSTPTNRPPTWGVNTMEVPTVSNAHEMMVARFTQSSLAGIVPGTNHNFDVGDKCYVQMIKSNLSQAVYFCRNNVFVEISARATNNFAGCLPVASEIDSQILEDSTE